MSVRGFVLLILNPSFWTYRAYGFGRMQLFEILWFEFEAHRFFTQQRRRHANRHSFESYKGFGDTLTK